jgi:hypothetical protein
VQGRFRHPAGYLRLPDLPADRHGQSKGVGANAQTPVVEASGASTTLTAVAGLGNERANFRLRWAEFCDQWHFAVHVRARPFFVGAMEGDAREPGAGRDK